MKHDFEEFKEVGRRAKYIPMVSITKEGNFNLNKAFIENYIGPYPDYNPNYVKFYYDKENQIIAFKIIDEYKKNSYRIRFLHAWAATISARAFLKYYKIPFSKTSSYEAVRGEDSDLILIDIKKK